MPLDQLIKEMRALDISDKQASEIELFYYDECLGTTQTKAQAI